MSPETELRSNIIKILTNKSIFDYDLSSSRLYNAKELSVKLTIYNADEVFLNLMEEWYEMENFGKIDVSTQGLSSTFETLMLHLMEVIDIECCSDITIPINFEFRYQHSTFHPEFVFNEILNRKVLTEEEKQDMVYKIINNILK